MEDNGIIMAAEPSAAYTPTMFDMVIRHLKFTPDSFLNVMRRIDVTVNLQGNATVTGDVFGGGKKGEVGGSATVNIE